MQSTFLCRRAQVKARWPDSDAEKEVRRKHAAPTAMASLKAITAWHNWCQDEYMKNFHLPLPEETYNQLKAEAEHAHVPATSLAREAIDSWLRQQFRKARHDAIAKYAAELAGTDFDLDSDLESAGIEHLLQTGRKRKWDAAMSIGPIWFRDPDRSKPGAVPW
jgi:hypothetical protein